MPLIPMPVLIVAEGLKRGNESNDSMRTAPKPFALVQIAIPRIRQARVSFATRYNRIYRA